MKTFGYELILDLKNCSTEKFNRKGLTEFFIELCDLIDMEREDLHFWDYEGHEDKIIKGSHKTIEKFRPSLFLEFHPSIVGKKSTLSLLARLNDYGYEIEKFIPRFLDFPLVGKISHVKKIPIEEYMEKLEIDDPIDGCEANVFLSI